MVVQLNVALDAVGVALVDALAEVDAFDGSLPTQVKTSSLPQEIGQSPLSKSQEGIVEAVVVTLGDDAARGRSCSILVVAEAVQEITSIVKKRKLSLSIFGARGVMKKVCGASDFFVRGGNRGWR